MAQPDAVAAVGVVVGADRWASREAPSHLRRLVRSVSAGGHRQLPMTVVQKLETDLRVLRGSQWTWGIVTVAAVAVWLTAVRGPRGPLLPRGSDRRTMAVALAAAALVGLVVDDAGVVVAGTALALLGAWLVTLAAEDLDGVRETLGYDPER